MKHSTLFRRFLCLLLILSLISPLLPRSVSAASDGPTEAEAYASIMAMKEKYPEGMTWTNDNYYAWKGYCSAYPWTGGWGCVAFAYMLSDAAFGKLDARTYDAPVSISQVRVGDILRINNKSHSVIVLEVHDSYVIIAEGNYNKSIHWGRMLTKAQVEAADYIITRYPTEPGPRPDAQTGFTDVNPNAYYYGALVWAVKNGIVSGTTPTTFSPNDTCDRAQLITLLWRAAGSPEPTGGNPFPDVRSKAYYYKAVLWAYEKRITSGGTDGLFHPDEEVTREDAVTFLWRMKGAPAPTGSRSPFPDVFNPKRYSYPAILWGYEKGIVQGLSSGLFGPKDPCNRAQIVCFLYRTFK